MKKLACVSHHRGCACHARLLPPIFGWSPRHRRLRRPARGMWLSAPGCASDYIFRGITQSIHRPVGERLFRASVQRPQGPAALCRRCGREHLVPDRSGRRDRFLGRNPTDLRPARPRLRRGLLLVSGRAVLQRQRRPVFGADCLANGYLPVNGNVIKADVSFWEVYAKGTFTVNEQFAIAAGAFYSNNVLNTGADGTYVFGSVKFTAPSNTLPYGLGLYVSGEAGYWSLGTSDAFFCTQIGDRTDARRRSRPAFPTRATPLGTSVSASPGACSPSMSATTTPT